MALEDYKKKRDFTKSPEPGPQVPSRKKGAPLFFCVQKHLASHLHYDLRLEWDGVLLSWAVPKGPSIDPKDKRLAMKVEDHPIAYGTFEGVIPEGYGAGVVMLWDRGTWEPEQDDVGAALKKGDLKFRINGFKLKGSWVLVKTHGFGGAPNSWLLIKHRDDWAGPIAITEFAPLSVKTPDADFEDILAGGTPDLWHSNPPAKGGDTGKMFQKIISRALEISASNKSATKGATAAKKTTRPRAKAKTAPKAAKTGTAAKTSKAKKAR